jgi:CRISPR-associated endonuclease Csn1
LQRIFGLDIGTTSIGWAVIDHDAARGDGRIVAQGGLPGMGARIFPEARDPDGTPLNQQRRKKRMMRRQLRRRRLRRRLLNELLFDAGLLPKFSKDKDSEWAKLMNGTGVAANANPYALRAYGLTGALSPHEFGRALYHLSKRRHFKGRELEDDEAPGADTASADEKAKDAKPNDAGADADEKEATKARAATLAVLKSSGETLGAHLAAKGADAAKGKPPTERRRSAQAHRTSVEAEFKQLWAAQAQCHPALLTDDFKEKVADAIFAQRPVFWRLNTLGTCPFVPGSDLCPKGAWLSQQKRMLEKLNNLGLAGGNARPLDDEERAAILSKLQTQATMSWSGVRSALAPVYKARDEKGLEMSLKFNLELGGDAKLIGNPLESRLSGIFGSGWTDHPHKQAIRDAAHSRLWAADYGRVNEQRVVICAASERARRRAEAAVSFVKDFGVSADEAAALRDLSFSTGWEPYSVEALRSFRPELERGVRFGDLLAKPEWEAWRAAAFPNRARPTGEVRDTLPSPNGKSPEGRDEQRRVASLRNPTVVRTQNELRKVVNNLIRVYGKPDKIRVEVGRDIGRSKREREEIKSIIRRNERQRDAARKDLQSKGIVEPSRDDLEKWQLWKESQEKCPYTGDSISFDALFRENRYQVEHIWPRSLCFDNGFRNKTLCQTDVNIEKGNRTPFDAFGNDGERWGKIENLLNGMVVRKGAV